MGISTPPMPAAAELGARGARGEVAKRGCAVLSGPPATEQKSAERPFRPQAARLSRQRSSSANASGSKRCGPSPVPCSTRSVPAPVSTSLGRERVGDLEPPTNARSKRPTVPRRETRVLKWEQRECSDPRERFPQGPPLCGRNGTADRGCAWGAFAVVLASACRSSQALAEQQTQLRSLQGLVGLFVISRSPVRIRPSAPVLSTTYEISCRSPFLVGEASGKHSTMEIRRAFLNRSCLRCRPVDAISDRRFRAVGSSWQSGQTFRLETPHPQGGREGRRGG